MEKGDIQCLDDPEEIVGENEKQRKQAEQLMKAGKRDMLGEGHCKLSWIWEGAGAESDADISTGMHEGKSWIGLLFLVLLITNLALCVQLAKSRARAS